MVKGGFERLGGWFVGIFRSETLDELPEVPVDTSRTSFFPWLFARESLPEDRPSGGGGGASFLGRLFAPEDLPRDPADERAGGRSFLAGLFGQESLPLDPEERAPGSGTRGRER